MFISWFQRQTTFQGFTNSIIFISQNGFIMCSNKRQADIQKKVEELKYIQKWVNVALLDIRQALAHYQDSHLPWNFVTFVTNSLKILHPVYCLKVYGDGRGFILGWAWFSSHHKCWRCSMWNNFTYRAKQRADHGQGVRVLASIVRSHDA